ncbi:MAG: hypothetical protein JWQ27_1065 [Ferruginibacter sp.]|nr:hypothetical protein [Ferruginibacter sp.]
MWKWKLYEELCICGERPDLEGNGHKKRGQPLTLTPNLHMNLPYCFIIRSVCFICSFMNCIT